jgi:hypothetical protein
MYRFPVSKDGILDFTKPANVYFGVTPKSISAPRGSQQSACDWGKLRKLAIGAIHPMSSAMADQIMLFALKGKIGSAKELAKLAVNTVDKDLGLLVGATQQQENLDEAVKINNLNEVFKNIHEGVLMTALENLAPTAFPNYPLAADPTSQSWNDFRTHALTLVDLTRRHWYPCAELWNEVTFVNGFIKLRTVAMVSRTQFYDDISAALTKQHARVYAKQSVVVVYLHLEAHEPLVVTCRVRDNENIVS